MTDTLQSKSTLKPWFATGQKPTGSQFNDWITSTILEGGNTGSLAYAVQIGGPTSKATALGSYGSFAQGKMVTSGGYGSFAQGDTVTASSVGAFAQGNLATASGVKGSFAQGDRAFAVGTYASFAQGISVIANGSYGSFAQGGNATSSGNNGSFAQGGSVTASGNAGSFAQGSVTWANGGNGSFAIGSAATANNVGAVQFSTGINSLEYSIKVKDSPRLCGNGTPSTISNGDIWITSGTVFVRSDSTTWALLNSGWST